LKLGKKSLMTKRLLSRGPSPLNPKYWPEAWQDFKSGLTALANETSHNWNAEATRAQVRNELPIILVSALIGLVLLVMGRSWAEKLGNFLRRVGGRGTGVWSFIVSLARIVLPFLGIAFLVQSVVMTGVLGVRGTLIAQSVEVWALIILSFNWLSEQLYSGHRDADLVPSPESRRGEMIIYVKLLAVILVLRNAVNLYNEIENLSDASRAVVAFPVILAAALLLLRLQRVGMSGGDENPNEDRAKLRSPGVYRIITSIRRGAVL